MCMLNDNNLQGFTLKCSNCKSQYYYLNVLKAYYHGVILAKPFFFIVKK